MQREGCELSLLMRRIAETPPDFLEEPLIGRQGVVAVSAVVGDLCVWLGFPARPDQLQPLVGRSARADRNRLRVTLVGCWLLAEPWFAQAGLEQAHVLSLLTSGASELAQHVAVEKLVRDVERREELARFALARLGYRPRGETVAQAEDRLTSLSAAERARVLSASRQAEERARQVREALARKAAEEAADKYTRE